MVGFVWYVGWEGPILLTRILVKNVGKWKLFVKKSWGQKKFLSKNELGSKEFAQMKY